MFLFLILVRKILFPPFKLDSSLYFVVELHGQVEMLVSSIVWKWSSYSSNFIRIYAKLLNYCKLGDFTVTASIRCMGG